MFFVRKSANRTIIIAMKHIVLILITFAFTTLHAQEKPTVMCGSMVRLENFDSEFVQPRHVDIWLPENYTEDSLYAVLYMHDGQMLFDSAITWNGQTWDADDTACRLMAEGKLQPFIIVGIWNPGANRHRNYFPQKPFDRLPRAKKKIISAQLKAVGRSEGRFQPNSDDYLKFLITELKPFINNRFSVYTDAAHTFIAGSSMGGLISLYAVCEYPNVFGGAACMSTHWPGTFTAENPFPKAYFKYLNKKLPSPEGHKLYFDHGDRTLDRLYPPLQAEADKLIKRAGYNSRNFKSLYFKGKNHSENSWRERFEIPLVFLLGK